MRGGAGLLGYKYWREMAAGEDSQGIYEDMSLSGLARRCEVLLGAQLRAGNTVIICTNGWFY